MHARAKTLQKKTEAPLTWGLSKYAFGGGMSDLILLPHYSISALESQGKLRTRAFGVFWYNKAMVDILTNLHTYGDWGLLALRIALGVIFIVHGAAKLAMWHSAPAGSPPNPMAGIMKILSIAEPLGGAAIIVGFLTQPAALGLAIIMVGAMYFKTQKWKIKFWAMDNTGWEFDFLILASSIALVTLGAGAISLDSQLFGL